MSRFHLEFSPPLIASFTLQTLPRNFAVSNEPPKDNSATDGANPQSPIQGSPIQDTSTAAAKFRDSVQAKQAATNDYDPEQELWVGGYSGKAMVGTWMLIGLISVALVVAGIMIAIPILIAIPFIWLFGGLVYAWRRLSVSYQLTSQRFIHQVGILTRKTDRIEVIDLDDVSFTQGPIERILGVGTIVLTGSDRTHPTLSMIGIADVKEVAGLIDDVRRQERRRRSLHIEAI